MKTVWAGNADRNREQGLMKAVNVVAGWAVFTSIGSCLRASAGLPGYGGPPYTCAFAGSSS
jgi:hypothetical protein